MRRRVRLLDVPRLREGGARGFSEHASDREEDILDKAFDVKSNSRLGCQSKITCDTTVVIEISRESRQAFLDEHPEIRAALKAANKPAKLDDPPRDGR